MNRQFFAFVTGIAMLVGLASQSRASYVITIAPQGSNVVATGSGSIDLTGLTSGGTGNEGAFIWASQGVAGVGYLAPGAYAPYYNVSFTSGPSDFGTGNSIVPTSTTGTLIEIQAGYNFQVASTYTSDESVSGTATFNNTTLSAMGLTPGTYTWTWGTGAPSDVFTLNIDSVPEPSSLLLGLGLISLLAMARRRRQLELISR